MKPEVTAFFDQATNTFSYLVTDPVSQACAIIDSVLNFDHASGSVTYTGADDIVQHVENHNLQTQWIIETHVHADHLSAAPYLQSKVGGKLAIGQHVDTIQQTFGKIFNEGSDFQRNG